jgi:hypothetical protein
MNDFEKEYLLKLSEWDKPEIEADIVGDNYDVWGPSENFPAFELELKALMKKYDMRDKE